VVVQRLPAKDEVKHHAVPEVQTEPEGFRKKPSSPAADKTGPILYRGVSKCEGTQIEVSFAFDPSTSKITDFVAVGGCSDGTGAKSKRTFDEPIEVKPDGSFSYKDKSDFFGGFVKGTITSVGKASGEIGPSTVEFHCGDGKYYPECGKWTALASKSP
jgi:hypothetical protein